MANKFKPIKLSDLNLSKAEMAKLAMGAAIFVAPPPEVEDVVLPVLEDEPLVTRRPLVDE